MAVQLPPTIPSGDRRRSRRRASRPSTGSKHPAPATAPARPLTARQRQFVAEYLIDQNGTAAYRRAYPKASYNTARTEAARLLANPCIRDEVETAQRDLEEGCRVDAERVVRELGFIAFSDIRDLFQGNWRPRSWEDIPPATRRAVAAMKVRVVRRRRIGCGDDAVEETVELIEVRMANKVRALDMLARQLGLYQELPPLEVVLARLPAELARQVRMALATTTTEAPSTGDIPTG